MSKLFTIERFSFSKTGDYIAVTTDKGNYIVNREAFERWVDDREFRRDGYYLMEWDQYYAQCGEVDLYDYLIIRAGSSILDDIKKGIDSILN